MCYFFVAKIIDLNSSRILKSILHFNNGSYFLSVLFIRTTDYLHLLYSSKMREEIFNLFRVYIFSSPNNHILRSPDNSNIIIMVHHTNISTVQESTLVDRLLCLLWVAPILSHHWIASHTILSWSTPWNYVATLIYDLHFEMC